MNTHLHSSTQYRNALGLAESSRIEKLTKRMPYGLLIEENGQLHRHRFSRATARACYIWQNETTARPINALGWRLITSNANAIYELDDNDTPLALNEAEPCGFRARFIDGERIRHTFDKPQDGCDWARLMRPHLAELSLYVLRPNGIERALLIDRRNVRNNSHERR